MQSLNKSSRRCAHAGVIFSPPHLGLPMLGAGREAIVFTTHYVLQWGAKEEQTVGLGTPPLKGVAQPLAVYRVLSERMARSRLEAAGSTGWTPLVGREQEIALLRERWV